MSDPPILLSLSQLYALGEYSCSLPDLYGRETIGKLWRSLRRDGGWDVGCWEVHPDDSRRAIVRWYRPVCVPDGADVRLTPDGQAWIASAAGTTICTTNADWLAWVLWRVAVRAAIGPRLASWEAA